MKTSLLIQKIFLFLVFYILITIRNDGYFPFKPNQNSDLLLLASVINIILLFFTLIAFFGIDKILFPRLTNFISKHLVFFAGLLSTGLIFTTVLLYYKNYLNFREYYYFNLTTVLTIAITSVIIILVSLAVKRAKLAMLCLFIESFALSIIPITYFPLISKIGDLMPIIVKQLQSFISGQNIYQYYLLDNGVLTQAVRQPGTILSYLPTYLLHLDLRYMGILFTFGTCLLFLKLSYIKISDIKFNKKFFILYIIISLILLSPYRLNRLDVYEPIFWFLITLSIYFVKNKKYRSASIIWGLGIFTQVWFWLFTPFYLLYLYRKVGRGKTLFYSIVLICLFGVFPLCLFVFRDTNAYFQNVFGYYGSLLSSNQFSLSSFYLTPVFIKAGASKVLTLVQTVTVILTFLTFIKSKNSLKTFLIFISLGFFVFIQFNSLTWNYMYLDLFVLMLIYLVCSLSNFEAINEAATLFSNGILDVISHIYERFRKLPKQFKHSTKKSS